MVKNIFNEKDIKKTIFEDRWVRFAFGAQGHIKNKDLNLGIVEFDKNIQSLAHEHNVDEALYVLKGSGSVQVGEDILKVKKGDFLFVPQKTNHKIITDSGEKLQIFFIFGREILIDY